MIVSKKGAGNIKIILFLFIILLIAVAGFILLAHYVGLFNAKEIFYPYIAKVPYVGRYIEPEVVTGELLTSEKLAKREKSLDSKELDIKKKEEELNKYGDLLKKREIEIKEKEKDLISREKALVAAQQKEEAHEKKLQRQAYLFENMKPQESSKKLNELPEELAIEILKRIKDQKTVAVILMNMDDKKAAALVRKMTR